MLNINYLDIISYKIKPYSGYSNGGWYMIVNKETKQSYIGKSQDYMARLKQHTYKSTNKMLIDIEINNNINIFEYFLLLRYDEIGIDFKNRKYETIIEQTLIKKYNTIYPQGYNVRTYEHIRIK